MRPEYIKCVRVAHEYAKGFTWCQQRAEGFVLTGVDHAALLSVTGSRLTVCEQCQDAIGQALDCDPPAWLVELARAGDPRSPEEAAKVEAAALRECKLAGSLRRAMALLADSERSTGACSQTEWDKKHDRLIEGLEGLDLG